MAEENDVVMAEMTLEALQKDGTVMRAAMGEVFVMRDGLMRERRAYVVPLVENDCKRTTRPRRSPGLIAPVPWGEQVSETSEGSDRMDGRRVGTVGSRDAASAVRITSARTARSAVSRRRSPTMDHHAPSTPHARPGRPGTVGPGRPE